MRDRTRPAINVDVEAAEPVDADLVQYAKDKVAAVLRAVRDPVLHVRVRLGFAGDPAVPRRALAQANVDVNGRLLRGQAVSTTLREAIDELQDHLQDRIDRLSRDWEARRGGMPSSEPHEWRHGSEPTHRAPGYPRPVDERQLVRHKTFTLMRSTPDEAAFDMSMLGYDFHLFTDNETGQDSVVYRTPDGLRLAQLEPRSEHLPPTAAPVTVSAQPAAVLSVEAALDRLEVGGQPFVFFRNAVTGRGNVVYLRYDGHYGLIRPAD